MVFTMNFTTETGLGAALVPAVATVTPQLVPGMIAAIQEASCVKPVEAGMCCWALFDSQGQLLMTKRMLQLADLQLVWTLTSYLNTMNRTNHRAFPHTGGSLLCTLEVKNTGNSGLQALSVPGQPNCTELAKLGPGSSASCRVSKSVLQADFDIWDIVAGTANAESGMLRMSVTVTATPTAAALASHVQSTTAAVAVSLVSQPSFKVLNASLLGPEANRTVRAGASCLHLASSC